MSENKRLSGPLGGAEDPANYAPKQPAPKPDELEKLHESLIEHDGHDGWAMCKCRTAAQIRKLRGFAPKPRTLEEIAERVWLDGEDDMHYEVFLAALREAADSAADARDAELIAWATKASHKEDYVGSLVVYLDDLENWLDSRKDQA